MSVLVAVGTPLLVLALGAVVLLWGSDEFMEHLPPLTAWIGLPLYAVSLVLAGIEPEEFTTAVLAAAGDRPVLAVADAIGSNVTITALGLGVAMAFAPLRLGERMRRFALVASACGLVAVLALADGSVAAWEGGVLLVVYVGAVALLWRIDRAATLREAPDAASAPRLRRDAARTFGGVGLGLLAMVVGGALAVDGATRLAAGLGWSHRATGLVVLALATSVEVFALVVAARRHGIAPVAVAALLGSFVFNATVTIGAAALVHPLWVPGLWPPAVVAAALPLLVLAMRGPRTSRLVGVGLVVGYAAFVTLVLGRWL